jgi:hypothetical protein
LARRSFRAKEAQLRTILAITSCPPWDGLAAARAADFIKRGTGQGVATPLLKSAFVNLRVYQDRLPKRRGAPKLSLSYASTNTTVGLKRRAPRLTYMPSW